MLKPCCHIVTTQACNNSMYFIVTRIHSPSIRTFVMSMNVQVNKDADDYCHLNTLNYSASAADGTMQCNATFIWSNFVFFAHCAQIFILMGRFCLEHSEARINLPPSPRPPTDTRLYSACPNKLFRILDNLMTALGTFEYIAFNLQ